MRRTINFLLVAILFSTSFFIFANQVSVDFVDVHSADVHSADVYPVVILGGGVGGLTSGIYLSRAGVIPLIVEGKDASQITQSHLVENWPGEEKIAGHSLLEKIKSQAIANGCKLASKEVIAADFSKRPFEITLRSIYNTEKIETIKTSSCIIATGSYPNRLNITGEDTYFGKGVSSCALCDGAFYKKKTVAVVGGSDAALVEAIYLSNLAKKVYVIIRKGDFRDSCDKKNKQLLLKKGNVEVIYNSTVTSILGDRDKVEKIELKSLKDGKISPLNVDGIFLAIGSTPNSSFFKGQIELDPKGYIILKEGNMTSKEGIFAVGDIVSSESKQAIIAAANGAVAAIEAQKYLSQNNLGPYSIERKSDSSDIVGSNPVSSDLISFDLVSLDKKNNIQEEYLDKVLEITSDDQFEKILSNSSIPILIDFYATWCGPCKRIAPFLSERSKSLAGVVKILKVDVDKHSSITRKYKITALPTLVIVDNNKNYISRKIGPDAIVKLINEIDKMKDGSKREISDFIISLM